ncbi:hypothetical protein T484DRAFT_1752352 [Baffinella frigidus]|nr:hypothetical protein T484DRAFT_1752352 [Cryptophyta sp. CCMP2293]
MASASNPINLPTQEFRTGLDFERHSRFEEPRPNLVSHKILRGVSASSSSDDLLDNQSPAQSPELVSANFMRAVEVISAEYRLRPQHPAASHDEFLARRLVQRAPRVNSLEAKLTCVAGKETRL